MSSSSSAFRINKNGQARWFNEDTGPTQAQLGTFLSTNRDKLTEPIIAVEHGKDHPSLNFETIGTLPALRSLVLAGGFIDALSFTTSNTPVLESLNISLLSCEHTNGLRFELALPLLKSFQAEHIMVDGPCDFGLSLSRCPMLQKVYTYKFRYLSGDNFVILPDCEELTLYRSECTDSLEVLSAPKLKIFSVQSSYGLEHVRLWDLPNEVLVQDVEKLVGDLLNASKSIGEELAEWAKKWKDETFTGRDAFERNWIEWEDVDGFDFNTHPYMNEILSNHMEAQYRERREMVKQRIWKGFNSDLAKRRVVNNKEKLPRCELQCANVTLSKSSRDHLMANKRVELVGLFNEDMLF